MDPRQIRKLGVGVVLATILFLLPTPDGLTEKGMDTLALFAVVVYFWATEALPLPVTALGAGAMLAVVVTDTPNEAWGPFASDTIFLLLGSLILADAVTKTGMDRVLSARFLNRMGGSTDSLLFGIVLVSTLSATIVASHAIAAVMLPLVLGILRSTGLMKRKNIAAAYMLAVAFGTGVAGVATPSAGARNAIVIGYLNEYGVNVSYLDWTLHAMPISLAMIPLVFLVLKVVFRVPHEKVGDPEVPGEHQKLDSKQWITIMVLLTTVVLWITKGSDWGLGTVAVLGGVSLFVFGILDWVDTRNRIAWGVPLIYGAALAMGEVLRNEGAAEWLAMNVLNLGEAPPTVLITVVVLSFTIVLTQFMSDGGTAAVVAPVTLALAVLSGYPLKEMGMLTGIAAAFSFILVVGTPPNVICYSSGLFTSRELAKAGLPLVVLGGLVTFLAVQFYWPLLG